MASTRTIESNRAMSTDFARAGGGSYSLRRRVLLLLMDVLILFFLPTTIAMPSDHVVMAEIPAGAGEDRTAGTCENEHINVPKEVEEEEEMREDNEKVAEREHDYDPELIDDRPRGILIDDEEDEDEFERHTDVFVEYGRNLHANIKDVLEWLHDEFGADEDDDGNTIFNNKSVYDNGDILKEEDTFYFDSDSLEIREVAVGNKVDEAEGLEDDDENFGEEYIFAKREIPKNSLLMKIPYSSFVQPHLENQCRMTPCETAYRVVEEYQKRFRDIRREAVNHPAYNDGSDNYFVAHLLQDVDDGLYGLKNLEEYMKYFKEEYGTNIIANKYRKEWPVLSTWSIENQQIMNRIVLGDGEHYNNETISGIEPPRFGIESILPDSLSCEPFDQTWEPWRVKAWNKYPLPTKQILQTILAKFHLRQWNHRFVPLYHIIPRSDGDDVNAKHSEMLYEGRTDYILHSSRDIKAGEKLVLPYHSVAQQFSLTGSIDHGNNKDISDRSSYGNNNTCSEKQYYRFWIQTMFDTRDQHRGDNDAFVTWDYYPHNQTVIWVVNGQRRYEEYFKDKYGYVGYPYLNQFQRDVFYAQYRNLQMMRGDVLKATNTKDARDDCDNEEERNQKRQIIRYYELWTESLGRALVSSRQIVHHEDAAEVILDEKLLAAEDAVLIEGKGSIAPSLMSVSTPRYNALTQQSDHLRYENFTVSADCESYVADDLIYEKSESFYNDLSWTRYNEFEHDVTDTTCLLLNSDIHSCKVFWPHTHETIVHYPASFIPKGEIKRVLFVGGGDIILLHEILRYPSLEFVIGMELDQAVVRDSFRNYGLQPKFDDPRVHWWFGDAQKSLGMLPPEQYFGTFDLVLIDLMTPICRFLRVGPKNEEIEDYMMKLLRPSGILIRQDDDVKHLAVDFAKYTVDLDITDMPHKCHQSFTMGSNFHDFTKKRYDHDLKDLVLYEPNVDSLNHTQLWSNYRAHLEPPLRFCSAIGKSDGHKSYQTERSEGTFVAMDIENVDLTSDAFSSVCQRITQALEVLGFTSIVHHSIPNNQGIKSSTYSMESFFFFLEGYVTIRIFPKHQYCSLDLQLWNNVRIQHEAVGKLVSAVGGNGEKDEGNKKNELTSFQITTCGMYVTSNDTEKTISGGTNNDFHVPLWCDMHNKSYIHPHEWVSVHNDVCNEVLLELTSILMLPNPFIMVLCPDSQIPCTSLEAVLSLKHESPYHIFPIRACSDIVGGLKQSALMKCEEEVLKQIKEEILRNGRKINGIIIDQGAPKELGQIIHRIFNDSATNYETLDLDYTIIAPIMNPKDYAVSQWRYHLLERFRIDFVEFNPVFHATIFFSSSVSPQRLKFELLSVGNNEFYSDLITAFKKVSEKMSLSGEILESKQGIISYNPNHKPSKFARGVDYDMGPSLKQLHSQQQVGEQVIAQYQISPENSTNCPEIKNVVDHALIQKSNGKFIGSLQNDTASFIYNVGAGCVLRFNSLENDTILLTFDGRRLIVFNIYKIMSESPILEVEEIQNAIEELLVKKLVTKYEIVQFDSQPRGYGSIVNFEEDIFQKVNFGMKYDEVQRYVKDLL